VDDSQLVKYCKEGKAKYQKMLLEKYSSRLLAVASRYVYDREEAKDILQDSWIKIFRAMLDDSYNEEGKLMGWMTRIVINTALKNKNNTSARVDNNSCHQCDKQDDRVKHT